MKIYIIPGDPTPLARPRLSHRKVYDSQKNIKLCASITLQQQVNNAPLLEGPLHLDVTFFMGIPKSISAKRRIALLTQPHIFKPDTDNLIKYICDICSGLLYYDDCIIATITAKKIYSDEPRTEFTLKKI
jgi:Holliday junction resolvase RusA-like endonuclease